MGDTLGEQRVQSMVRGRVPSPYLSLSAQPSPTSIPEKVISTWVPWLRSCVAAGSFISGAFILKYVDVDVSVYISDPDPHGGRGEMAVVILRRPGFPLAGGTSDAVPLPFLLST